MNLKHYLVVVISFALGFIMGLHPSFEIVRGFIINGLSFGLALGVVINMVGLLQEWYKEKHEKNRNHTNDLKKVIEQWIKLFPMVSTEYPHTLDHEIRLTIEDEYIFKDLLFHLDKQEPQIVEFWDDFKDKCMEQYKERKELVSEISKGLTKQIEKEVGIGQFGITKYGIEPNSISEHYLNAIFYACILYANGEKDEFSKFYQDFESHTGHKDNTIGYSISHLDTGSITIEKGLLEENEFKTKMDGAMMQMFEKAKTDYNSKGEKVVNMAKDINSLKDRIKKLLGDQLNYQEFKGKCRYL